jgi:hypothetical protein
MSVLNINKTFLVAFSFCPSESTESIGFVWESLKAEYFINDISISRVIMGDWTLEL